MKRLILALLLTGSSVFACEKGYSPYNISANQSVCVSDQEPLMGEPVKPSNEKPRRGQVPEWQDGTVHAFVSKPKTAVEIPDTVQNHKGDLIPVDKE